MIFTIGWQGLSQMLSRTLFVAMEGEIRFSPLLMHAPRHVSSSSLLVHDPKD